MILSVLTATALKAGELFLSGCMLGTTTFKMVKNALKKEE